MSGFDVDVDSLARAADAIDEATSQSGARGLTLDAPWGMGSDDLDRAAGHFAGGWTAAATGMVRSSDDLSQSLRGARLAYLISDQGAGVLLRSWMSPKTDP